MMKGFVKDFRELDVYQNARSLALEINRFCRTLPGEERFELASQMRRASRSICANIAEAWRKRRYEAAFKAKLSDAETEAAEMQCWIDLALALEYMDESTSRALDTRYEQVLSQLVHMINHSAEWCTLKK